MGGGGVVETEFYVQWYGCNQYYLLVCGGGGMNSFSRVVTGWDSNSVVVGGDGDCSNDAALVVDVCLVRVLPLSITTAIIMARV